LLLKGTKPLIIERVKAMREAYKKIPCRITVIDLLKLTGMIFICIPHCLQRWGPSDYTSTLGFSFFYSVGLSMFFFSSGIVLRRITSLKDLLIFIVKTVGVYLTSAFIFTVLSIYTLPRFTLLEKDFGYWMNELYLRTDTFYWYSLVATLINIFIASAYYFVSLIKKNNLKWDIFKASLIIILTFAYSMIFLHIYNREDLGPGCLGASLVLYYLPITLFGFLFNIFKPYLLKLPRQELLKGIATLVALVIYIPLLIVYRDWLPHLNGSFWTISALWICSLSGTIVYYYLLSKISHFTIAKKVSYYGFFSGQFYLVHVYIIRLFATYIPRPETFDFPAIMFVTFLTIIFTIGSILITVFLRFIPYTDFLLFISYDRYKDIIYPHRWLKRVVLQK
jgi:hypothetical protein